MKNIIRKIKSYIKDEKGMQLLEVLIIIGIVVMVGVIVYAVLKNFVPSWLQSLLQTIQNAISIQ